MIGFFRRQPEVTAAEAVSAIADVFSEQAEVLDIACSDLRDEILAKELEIDDLTRSFQTGNSLLCGIRNLMGGSK